jgi:hypothetical protein
VLHPAFETVGDYFPVLHAKSTSAICFNSQIDNASVATLPLGTRGNSNKLKLPVGDSAV